MSKIDKLSRDFTILEYGELKTKTLCINKDKCYGDKDNVCECT
jgi:hypothetical protein